MKAWWQRRSRRAKTRLIFYPTVVLSFVAFLAYAMVMPGTSHHGGLAPLTPDQEKVAARLRLDVAGLAGPGSRSQLDKGSLERASALISNAFEESGYQVTRLPYDSNGTKVENLEVVLTGTSKANEIVVVGAHYDTANGGPGADDNASGVAAMLAISRAMAGTHPARTIRFVAFVNEEPPYFWNAEMGSLVYAKACKVRNDDIVAMLSLETLGYFRDEPGTQKYPPIVNLFYPSRGDFIAFVGNLGSRGLVRDSIREFRNAAAFPSEGAAMPSFVAGVGWSDHWSFWQVGYRAVMVTDTAPFRNPNYHQMTDRPDTLDYPRLARVTDGLVAVTKKLAE